MSNMTVIMNPVSGGKRNRDKLIKFISEYFGIKSNSSVMKCTSARGDATHFAREAIKEGRELVVAVGGDGTINEVASGLVGTSVPLGIIPMGSGNGLARSLRIPLNLAQACRLIRERRVFPIDVGKANSRYFFLVAGFGFDAAVGQKFDNFDHRGALSYFYIGAKEFLQYQPETLKLTFDNQTLKISPFIAACANGQQYGNNAIIAPEAKLDDGFLDLCIVHPMNLLHVLDAAPKLFNGRLDQFSKAEFFKTNFVVVEREHPGMMNIDGEPVFEEAKVEISVLPKKLQVIASDKSTCLSK